MSIFKNKMPLTNGDQIHHVVETVIENWLEHYVGNGMIKMSDEHYHDAPSDLAVCIVAELKLNGLKEAADYGE